MPPGQPRSCPLPQDGHRLGGALRPVNLVVPPMSVSSYTTFRGLAASPLLSTCLLVSGVLPTGGSSTAGVLASVLSFQDSFLAMSVEGQGCACQLAGPCGTLAVGARCTWTPAHGPSWPPVALGAKGPGSDPGEPGLGALGLHLGFCCCLCHCGSSYCSSTVQCSLSKSPRRRV